MHKSSLPKTILAIALFFTLIFSSAQAILGDENDDLGKKRQEIEELERRIEELQGQKKTLSATIKLLDSKIYLAQLQIAKTQAEIKQLGEEITDLAVKINDLNQALEKLSQAFVARIQQTYKYSDIKPIYLLFTSQGFSQFLSRIGYLKIIQTHDRHLMVSLEQTRSSYDQQRELKQEKQTEVETLNQKLEADKIQLTKEQANKKSLLEVTKNDEQRYKEMLAKALAELEAIQSIIAGRGEETEVGHTNTGDRIASLIIGSSACSNGTHLHFEVVIDKNHQNPAEKLKPLDFKQNCDQDGNCWDNQPDGPFSFSGSWEWPINQPLRITQGYGQTFYSTVLNYYNGAPHTGLDMVNRNQDLTVKAVKNGTLYRGAIACGSGTLRYVHLKHDEENINTYYLHVNY